MKVLVFGANGYLGTQFLRYLSDSVGTSTDIADGSAAASELDHHAPNIALNCAGKTGRPTVDWCESHKAETVRSNVLGPVVLAEACQARHILLVHLSSGCLFEGTNEGRGFAEDDRPNFEGSFYSRSKAYAEYALQGFPVLIIRPRMPFDGTLHPRGLIGKLVRYRQVLDAPNSLTYVPDLLETTRTLMMSGRTGIYNVANPGLMSPLEIVERYRNIVDPTHTCEAISAANLDRQVAARRSNCQLSTEKLEAAGIHLRHVTVAVDEALHAIRNQRKGFVD